MSGYPDEFPYAEGGYQYLPDGSRISVARVLDRLDSSFDDFDQLIADSRTNNGDLPAHFDFSPDRWRLGHDAGSTGTYVRRFVQYGETSNFTDGDDSMTLAPGNGDTMRLRTAPRFQYVVQYVIKPSWAFQLSQSLGTGDKATIAYGEADLNNDMAGAEGLVIEMEPGLADDEVYFSDYRAGTIKSNGGTRKKVSLEEAITRWLRYAMPNNWYNVGAKHLVQSTTADGVQSTDRVGSISSDGIKGGKLGNHRIEFSLQSGGNGTQMEVGSAGLVTLGGINTLFRPKGFDRIGDDSVTITDVWEPVLALRVDPARTEVVAQLSQIEALSYSASATARLQAQAFDPSKLSFGGGDSWGVPAQLSPQSSVQQIRTDVSGYPDSSGTQVAASDSWTSDPGGYQVFRSVLSSSGTGSRQTQERARTQKMQPIHDLDVIVLLARSGSTGTLEYTVDIEEDW